MAAPSSSGAANSTTTSSAARQNTPLPRPHWFEIPTVEELMLFMNYSLFVWQTDDIILPPSSTAKKAETLEGMTEEQHRSFAILAEQNDFLGTLRGAANF